MSELTKYIETPEISNKFLKVLGENKKKTFVNSLIQVVSDNDYLKKCKPDSIVGAALMSANFNLPINNTLGYAYVVPYGNNAQFQIGYKGLKQLALRTNNYKKLTVNEVFDGELLGFNRFKEEYDFSGTPKNNAQIIGYCAYMQLNNGFEKTIYWTVKKCKEHGQKFSKTFSKNYSPWQSNFDAMAKKTVLKHLLSNWGDLTINEPLQNAINNDQSIIDSDLNANFDDNPANESEKIINIDEVRKNERLEKWNLFKYNFEKECKNANSINELQKLSNSAIFEGKSVSTNETIKNILNKYAIPLQQKDNVQDAEIVQEEKDF